MSVTGLLSLGLILAIAGLLLTEVVVWRLQRRVTKLERRIRMLEAIAPKDKLRLAGKFFDAHRGPLR